MLTPLLLTLPWLGILLFLTVWVRLPRPLPPVSGSPKVDAPLVSVIVPARNEARNVEGVLTSLAMTSWPRVEILLVDDRSEDDTAARAAEVAARHPDRVRVLEGEPLPAGWLGKPWACHQGARAAQGDLLLFTDADTRHAPDLLTRAVGALGEDAADAVSLAGRQLMESFWERLVQPHVFTAMLARYPRHRRPLPPERWRSAIANGQYILVRRDTYDAMGGHEALKGEVVEDMRMAQRLVHRGHRLSLRGAEDVFATRMYAGLGEIVEGWSKNVFLGGLATLPPWMRWVTPPLMILGSLLLWIMPPLVLLGAAAGLLGGAWLAWSGAVVALSLVLWCAAAWRMGAPVRYGLLYPLGALVTAWIFVRAWRRGGRVRWKGREYALEADALMGEP